MTERSNSPKRRLDAVKRFGQISKDEQIVRFLNGRWEKEGLDVARFVEEYSTALEKLDRRIIIDTTKNPPIRRIS